MFLSILQELCLLSCQPHVKANGLTLFACVIHCIVTWQCIRHVLFAEDRQPKCNPAAATAEVILSGLGRKYSNQIPIVFVADLETTSYYFSRKFVLNNGRSEV